MTMTDVRVQIPGSQRSRETGAVSFNPRVASGIACEILEAFHDVSRPEAGGILLGRRTGDRIAIEDFEPVLCEHRFGPSFALSAEDLDGLRQSLAWFRGPESPGLEVLGCYRSHTREESSPDEGDCELLQRYFGVSGPILLILSPSLSGAITAELFRLREGALSHASEPCLFPPEDPMMMLEPVEDSVPLLHEQADSAATRPAEAEPQYTLPTRPTLPPARPRRTEIETVDTPARRNHYWLAAVAALSIAAAVVGYRSVAMQTSPPAPPPGRTASPAGNQVASQITPAKSSQPLTPAPAVVRPAASAKVTASTPAPISTVEQGVREAIGRWQRAQRSGDPNLIAACYTAQLDRYFHHHNLPVSAVLKSAEQNVAKYGRPAILRISDVTIMTLSEDKAIVSFRKHWQTLGPRVFAGEEQERITLVREQQSWKISSEEETKVYWTQRARG